MFTIRVEKTFSAAHRVTGPGGKCEELHGHTYRVEVAIAAKKLDRHGMVVDFAEVRERLAGILPDHKYLNDYYEFVPTAENLARHLHKELAEFFPVTCVRVWESEDCSAEYRPAR